MCFHWEALARRYAGIPSTKLSFNLVNEPPGLFDGRITREVHERIIRAATAAVRAADPNRLIIVDGLEWAALPCPELVDLGVAQSCHAYRPFCLTHYMTEALRNANLPVPTWPGSLDRDGPWDRNRLVASLEGWADLARRGVGVHCGEFGCSSHTPHAVCLSWMRDLLEILTSHNIGFAMWMLRGDIGLMDSGRTDVVYEDWYGHKLDREMLKLMQEF
jgi:endoglucanase